jgi:protein-disulfide isomerase
VSRGYDARRKAKRQRARAAAESSQRQGSTDSPRAVVLLPVLAILAILIATAILGFGVTDSSSPKQIDQEVTALLAGIPQHGSTLGSPDAPVTLWMFADLECPTVRRFVESYLPSIIDKWVRTGAMTIKYRSLKTDTLDEQTFFGQEEAALAAGRQDKLWNYALTFVRQQGQHFTEYATGPFLVRIASQVPGLNMKHWDQDRGRPLLFRAIALGIRSAHIQGLRYTPSFTIAGPMVSARDEIESSLERTIQALAKEDFEDTPILRTVSR